MVSNPSETEIAPGVRRPLPACPRPSYSHQFDSSAGSLKSANRRGVPQPNFAAAVSPQCPAVLLGSALPATDQTTPAAAHATTTDTTTPQRILDSFPLDTGPSDALEREHVGDQANAKRASTPLAKARHPFHDVVASITIHRNVVTFAIDEDNLGD